MGGGELEVDGLLLKEGDERLQHFVVESWQLGMEAAGYHDGVGSLIRKHYLVVRPRRHSFEIHKVDVVVVDY